VETKKSIQITVGNKKKEGGRDGVGKTCRMPQKYLDNTSSSWHAICSKSTHNEPEQLNNG